MEQITLDLIPNGSLPVLHASQYDDGRQWKVNLTENGEDYTLSNETIVLNVRKGDGCAVTCAVAFESGKKYVTLVSTEQMCAVAGSNLAELRITKDGAVIGTLNFIIEVERDPLDAGIGSQSQIHDLQHQVDECVHTAFETIGAAGLPYDNTESGLTADNVQAAIDEVNEKASSLPSDVYTKEETDALLDEKADKTTLASDYYDKTEVDTALSGKADSSALNNYYTKAQTDSALSGKADKSNVYTKTQVNNLLDAKVDESDLSNYMTASEVSAALNLKADKSNTYTKSQVDTALSGKADASAFDNYWDKDHSYNQSQVDGFLDTKADKSNTYTKTQVDTALAGKVDNATLANYYTKSEVDALIDDLLPTGEASGAIASFTTSLTKPLVRCVAQFASTQASGVSEVRIIHCGANLWNEQWEAGSYDQTTGEKTPSTSLKRNVTPIAVKPNTNYARVKTQEGALLACRMFYYDANMTLISTNVDTTDKAIITTPNNCAFVSFAFQNNITALSFNYPSTDRDYHAYNPNSNATLINLGGTYYDGYVEQDKDGKRVLTVTQGATPYTIELPDGDPIIAFNGVNNLWSDSGDATVEYKQGIQEYVDAKLGNNNRGVNLLGLSAPANDLQRDEPDESSER